MLGRVCLFVLVIAATSVVSETASAQAVIAPLPVAVGYVPQRTGLLGLRTTYRPVLAAPAVAVPVVSQPVVTAGYFPAAQVAAPVTTTMYAPAAVAPTATVLRPALAPAYYIQPHWYSYPGPVPRTVGMPIIGF